MVLYIDGVLDIVGERTDDAWKGTKNSQDHIKIGAHDYSNTQGFFTGQLDEVKFFTRVLNEDEIKVEMRPDKRVAFSSLTMSTLAPVRMTCSLSARPRVPLSTI
jgi:hypothetical protein